MRKIRYSLIAAEAVFVIALAAARTMAAFAAVPVSWSNISLSESGDASWNASYPPTEAVDKYELQLARMRDGVWNTDYKTYKTEDSSYSISFSATGKYYFKVRAKFIGGDYSDWSGQSNTVSVTSEDIDHGDPEPWYYENGPMYNIVYNADGSYTYQTPAGPGANAPLITVTVGGMTGSSGNVIYNGFGGMGYSNRTSQYNSAINISQMPPGNNPISNASTGWIRTGDFWTYRYANGTVPRNTWDRINDKWYYFDQNGIMRTGWIWYNDHWYYCLPDGEMATGWNNVNEKWYYLNESGIMQTGYITVGGKMYYCDASGARVQSAYNPDGHLFDLNGVMIQ